MPADGELLSMLKKMVRTDDRSVATRRVEEAKPIAYAARRQMARSERTEQTNLKFTPGFKKQLVALALASDQSLTEYVEQAVMERMERGW